MTFCSVVVHDLTNDVSGFREDVENVSADRGWGCHLIFLISWTHKLGLVGGWVVLRVYVALSVFQPYRDFAAGDNQSLKHKLGRGYCVLSSCQVSANSVKRFQKTSRNREKLTMDGHRTTGEWRTPCDYKCALEPAPGEQKRFVYICESWYNVSHRKHVLVISTVNYFFHFKQ